MSESAKARGQTGFLHPRKDWCVFVKLANGKTEERHTHIKRDAHRSFAMLSKHSQHPIGKYTGATIRLSCDGRIMEESKP